MDTRESHPPEAVPFAQSSGEKFGWKHILSILFAIGITIGIFVFREHIQRFERLAYLGAFLAMLIGNATIILPVPGLIFVFSLSSTLNPLLVGLAGGLGAALGEFTGYLAGYGGSAIIDNYGLYRRFEGWMERYGLWTVFLLAVVPNPLFDMAGIVAGASRVKPHLFLLVALAGKTIQSLLVAYAGYLSLDWVSGLLTG